MKKLNGTEKQKQYAESIRNLLINGIVAGGAVMSSGITLEITRQEQKKKNYASKCAKKNIEKTAHDGYNWAVQHIDELKKLQTFVNACSDSSWFINHRYVKSVLELSQKKY